MKKRLGMILAGTLLSLLLLPMTAVTAYAKDYDEVVSYDITVQPNVDDGSLSFRVEFDWKALEELPYGQELKIGVPNGSIRDVQALTDNIEKLDFDNSYMYVYLTRAYDTGETFHFAYSWVQEYMYTLGDDGSVSYDYTPGWFDEAVVDHMTVTWNDPAEVGGSLSYEVPDRDYWKSDDKTLTGTALPHGSRIRVMVEYDRWPVELSWENSSENQGDWGGYEPDYNYDDGSDGEAIFMLVVIIIVAVVLIIVFSALRDGYSGGFGTHYVFYHNLWYPAGPDGKPRPGSVGTAHKPKPPASSHSSGGFGGGKRGGGFGGGGFGGSSHCACASSCACACACACAGGGRAGCSAKNLYGAIHLDEEMSRRLERPEE
ncbi:MAG: hypothetical protein E7426_03505 [Ruminococcaceae bacterium]|jgi:hypothetical protein|nr:hypothetical protein [Oscillospiraceae bacterium]